MEAGSVVAKLELDDPSKVTQVLINACGKCEMPLAVGRVIF